jgi:hypothetical protein
MSKHLVKQCLGAAQRRLSQDEIVALSAVVVAFVEDGAEDGDAVSVWGYAAGVR